MMKNHKGFFLTIFFMSLVLVGGMFFDAGFYESSPVSSTPDVPLMVAGFFGSVFGVVKKAVGVIAKVAPVIPGVGTVVAGAAAAVGALSKGGQVQTVTPATVPGEPATIQNVGTVVAQPRLQTAGFGGDLMNFKFMGIPIFPVLLMGLAVSFISRRRR